MFESLPYSINETGYIDYDKLAEYAKVFQPKLLICGGSAYPRDLDYKRFREIADSVGCLLMGDIAHISGLVATQEANNPFEYCDVITTTTHKTLRGPRSGMIFYKKEFESRINESVFPGVQGGPHNNKIAALCHQLYEVATPEFKEYIINVKKNAKMLADKLIELGYSISSNGTENHIVLVNVRDKGVTGSKVEKVCELADISINKNAVYGDTSAMNPGGIRLGSSAMTTRLCNETHFIKIAEFIDETVKICLEIQKEKGVKLKDFLVDIEKNKSIIELRNKVNEFSKDLYFPC
jgi:glycine hydroxymethyltransferase